MQSYAGAFREKMSFPDYLFVLRYISAAVSSFILYRHKNRASALTGSIPAIKQMLCCFLIIEAAVLRLNGPDRKKMLRLSHVPNGCRMKTALPCEKLHKLGASAAAVFFSKPVKLLGCLFGKLISHRKAAVLKLRTVGIDIAEGAACNS